MAEEDSSEASVAVKKEEEQEDEDEQEEMSQQEDVQGPSKQTVMVTRLCACYVSALSRPDRSAACADGQGLWMPNIVPCCDR